MLAVSAATTKGKASKLLEFRILRVAKEYRLLTVRQFYYIIISSFPEYQPGKQFYKRFIYHLKKVRQRESSLHVKIIDNTREHIMPSPIDYPKVELWVEKDAIRMMAQDEANRYRVSIQVLRGFGSLSMYRKALERAKSRGVKKILYLGDWDPSGIQIEKVAAKIMRGIKIKRIAITKEQAQQYELPAIKVNSRDSRANSFLKKNGIMHGSLRH